MYLGAIVAANLAVAQWGIAATIPMSFFFIGLDLTARDNLHEAWKGKGLVWKMGLLIASGSIISYLFNKDAGPIALASFVAFASAGIIDGVVFHLLDKKGRFLKVNGSNIMSAGVDTFLFQIIAFGVFAPLIFLGEWIIKTLGGAMWFWIFNYFSSRFSKKKISI